MAPRLSASPFFLSAFQITGVLVLRFAALEGEDQGNCRRDDGKNADDKSDALFHDDTSCCRKVCVGGQAFEERML